MAAGPFSFVVLGGGSGLLTTALAGKTYYLDAAHHRYGKGAEGELRLQAAHSGRDG